MKAWKFEKGPTRPAHGFPWHIHRTIAELNMKMPANAVTIEQWRTRNDPDGVA